MSWLEVLALLCSVTGVYILTGRPMTDRSVRVGVVPISVAAASGGVLTAVGLLCLVLFGVWPAEWWSWNETLLSEKWNSQKSPGLLDLPKQAPVFWLGAVTVVSGAVLVVVGSARVFRVGLIVFCLGGAILLGVGSDWAGVIALVGSAQVFLLLWRWSNAGLTELPPSERDTANSPEPFLATTICVLLAWGLIRAVHIAGTFEAGPDLSGMGTSPALPRAALVEVGTAEPSPEQGRGDSKEAWRLGLSVAVILLSGAAGLKRSREDDSIHSASFETPPGAGLEESAKSSL